MRAALEEFGAVEGMIEARAIDRRLHGLVTAAARNPHLTSLGANLTAAATLGFGAEPYAPEFLAQARAEHQEPSTTSPRVTPTRPAGARRSISRSRSSRCGPACARPETPVRTDGATAQP